MLAKAFLTTLQTRVKLPGFRLWAAGQRDGCAVINRYLMGEICRPFAVVLGILVALFASFSAAGFLADAVDGLLATHTILLLIGLKVLISLEVLIPISLYIGEVLAFGRLYADSEFTAMSALQVTPARIMGAVLTVSVCLAVVVEALSLFARPWAYDRMHALSRQAEQTINVDAMEAGTFYVGKDGNRVIFLGGRDGPGAPAEKVFVRLRYKDRIRIISAGAAYPLPQPTPEGDTQIYLRDAHVYDLGVQPGSSNGMLDAESFVVDPVNRDAAPPEYSAVAASSAALARSHEPRDVAEFQWRLSTPISTLLLSMLAVPLSRAKPRQSKYTKFGTAILIYSAYYLLCTSARTWVQHGTVPAFPGIWWSLAVLALVLVAALTAPAVGRHLRYR